MDESMLGSLLSFFAVIAVGILFVRFYPEIFNAIRFLIEKLKNM